jgi:membrane protein GlpM
MNMTLLIKAFAGAILVVALDYLSRTRNYFIVGLLPLFPTFALIGQYIVGTRRPVSELKSTLIFAMLSLIPYFIYLITVYLLVDKYKLVPSLITGVVMWFIVAFMLIFIWNTLTLKS